MPATCRPGTNSRRVVPSFHTSSAGHFALSTPQRGNEVDAACIRLGLPHECDESAVGRPGRSKKHGGMVGELYHMLLPDLLDVKIELVLLLIAKPGKNDLVSIRRKAGANFK